MNSPHAFDLTIKSDRVFCPKTGLDGAGIVAIRNGKIADVRTDFPESAVQSLEFPGSILLPGLIDLHAHPANSGSVFGVEPDEHILGRGVTTVLSQGDAGADNIEEYLRETVRVSRTRIRLAINLSRVGESTVAGCFSEPDLADIDACVAATFKHPNWIWGIAVNTSHHACGDTDPRDVLRRGLAVAEQTGRPLLYGMRRTSDWPFADQLKHLRCGDVVTYCFRREPHCIIHDGRVHPAIRDARERGVLFDVGHGAGSFSFAVAEAAIGDGFLPDTISTDLQQAHRDQKPTHDLPLVMSKFRIAGMPEEDVFKAVTSTPAKILGLQDEIGALEPGMDSDLSVLNWMEGPFDLVDTHREIRQGGAWSSRWVHRSRNGEARSIP